MKKPSLRYYLRSVNESPAIKLHLCVSANKPKYYERFKMNVNAFFTPLVSYFHKLSLVFNIKEKIRFISAALLKLPVSTKATTNCFCATKVLVSNCQEKRNLFFLFIIYIVCYKLWNQKFINHATKPCFGNV